MADVTLEEMEAQFTTPQEVKAADIKLDASDLPDFAKGKTAADLASEVDRMRQALRISEEGRLALADAARAREAAPTPAPRVPEAPAPTGPTELTREQLKELVAEDPMAVMDYMATHMTHRLDQHLNARFKPIVDGSISSAEAQAKAKYPEEFELFGNQIQEMKTKVPANVLGSSAGWDDMMSYLRGRPENFDKLVAKRNSKDPAAVRKVEVDNVGFSPRSVPTARVAAPAGNGPTRMTVDQMDDTMREIARTLGVSDEEYCKHY